MVMGYCPHKAEKAVNQSAARKQSVQIENENISWWTTLKPTNLDRINGLI